MNIRTTKRILQYATLLTAVGTAMSTAAAEDGKITFTGSISSTTCEIEGGGATVTGNSNGNFTVGLQPISATALDAAGARAGDTPFWIKLSGAECTNGKVATVYFEPAQSTNINETTGNLKNTVTTGGATNVEVGLLNGTKQAINLFTGTPKSSATIANNTAKFDFWAQYVATGGASTAGAVSTNVVYSILYN